MAEHGIDLVFTGSAGCTQAEPDDFIATIMLSKVEVGEIGTKLVDKTQRSKSRPSRSISQVASMPAHVTQFIAPLRNTGTFSPATIPLRSRHTGSWPITSRLFAANRFNTQVEHPIRHFAFRGNLTHCRLFVHLIDHKCPLHCIGKAFGHKVRHGELIFMRLSQPWHCRFSVPASECLPIRGLFAFDIKWLTYRSATKQNALLVGSKSSSWTTDGFFLLKQRLHLD